MAKISILCEVKAGHLIVPNRAAMQAQIAQLPDGPVTLTIGPEEPLRSSNQLRFYWKWLTILEDITGHSKDFLHEFFKDKFRFSLDSYTTTDAKQAAMSQYIHDVHGFAYDFFGVNLPDAPSDFVVMVSPDAPHLSR